MEIHRLKDDQPIFFPPKPGIKKPTFLGVKINGARSTERFKGHIGAVHRVATYI